MYASFFGLGREPFSIAPDPRFLFMSERHREALAHLLYGVRGGGGFVLLTGEIGAGKTTVGRCFLEQLPPHCVVAYIFNPALSVVELLQTVCAEFAITLPGPGASPKAHVDALNRFLLDAHAQGRQALLVIDEAQGLSAEVLEQLRLLTNLETAERKLLQIILIGQPELRTLLAQPGLEQLAQRVIARCHLGPLSAAETQQYVAHRLAVAGPNAASPFDAAAVAAIHRITGGVPRRINLLADRALLGAYAQGRHRVDRRTVARAAREVFDTAQSAPARRWALPAVVGFAAVLGAGTWAWSLGWLEPAGHGAADGSTRQALALPAAASAQAVLPASESASAPADAASAAVDAAPALADTAVAVAPPVAGDPSGLLAAAHGDEDIAWRELALRWNVSIGEGDPCQVAAQADLACFRSTAGGLSLLRQLARPGILALRGAEGQRVHALLVGLGERHATLQVGAQQHRLTLAALARVWRGDFATFWRTPPGWREGLDVLAVPVARAWVDRQLGDAGAGSAPATTLRQRVAAFQAVQGLPPDGRAGPLTLMQLNRAVAIDEPRLEPGETR